MKILATAREVWGPGHPFSYPGQQPELAPALPPLKLPQGRPVRLLEDDEPVITRLLAPLGRNGFVSCSHHV